MFVGRQHPTFYFISKTKSLVVAFTSARCLHCYLEITQWISRGDATLHGNFTWPQKLSACGCFGVTSSEAFSKTKLNVFGYFHPVDMFFDNNNNKNCRGDLRDVLAKKASLVTSLVFTIVACLLYRLQAAEIAWRRYMVPNLCCAVLLLCCPHARLFHYKESDL